MGNTKARLLTGDTPTGRLHLGHWVGSLENRVKLQDDYECFFLLADSHAFTTRAERPQEIHDHLLDITLDYLAAGIDPDKSHIFIESEIPAILELTVLFSMLVPFTRAMRNPTIKDEIRDKNLGDNYSFGFPLYQFIQVADILAFRAEIVPVGEDQIPHLELTREVARRFDQLYCGVDSHSQDADYVSEGGVFPIPEALIGRVRRLVGTGAPDAEGRLLKMSKSLGNAILLSDDNDTIRQKVMKMYTDPQRLKATDPGRVENNPLWIFHDTFNVNKAWVEDAKEKYRAGAIGDVECKKELIEILTALIEPMQRRRQQFAQDQAEVMRILQRGTERALAVSEETRAMVREATKQSYFARKIGFRNKQFIQSGETS